MMARPVATRRAQARMIASLVAALAVLALAAVAIPALLASPQNRGSSATQTPLVALVPSPVSSSGSGSAGGGGGVRPPRTKPTARAADSPRAAPDSPSPPTAPPPTDPAVSPTAGPPGNAPTRPQDFDLRRQQVDIGFPFRPDTRYAYRNNFLDLRDGGPEAYNHGRLDRAGTLVRLHDGIDIYAELGEPVVAPFSGTVVDPEPRWQPWVPSRYGQTVVIVSDEPSTAGYVALLAHMDRVWVDIGQPVARGQVVGTVGRSGNAEAQSIRPHLHFELRAPFLLDWTQLGHEHVVDAFNPYHSLVAADPKRATP